MYVIRKHSETATEKLPDLLKHGIHALQRREKRGRTGSAFERTGHCISNLMPPLLFFIPTPGRRQRMNPILYLLVAGSEQPADVGFARGERVVGLFGARTTSPVGQVPYSPPALA